ncbi:MAG: efflux RND transporter periplasmic adaptor subunit [Acidobacteria bacterium]|nr:efflux RND transporter periplasmic adaptor subunit [Acidobacteriota bacterium]
MKERLAWTAIVLTLAVSLAWSILGHQEKREEAKEASAPSLPGGFIEISPDRQRKMELSVSTVGSKSIRNSIRLTGEIKSVPGMEVAVTSPVSGRVVADASSKILTIGSHVTKGQVLTVLESFPSGSAGLSVEAQLRQEEATYAKALADWERAQRLYEAGLIALRDFDQAKADHSAAKGRLESLRKQFQLYRELQLSRGEETEPGRFWVRAPIDGVITTWNQALGQTLAADALLVTITNTQEVIAEANLFVDDLSHVRLGDPALCTTEAYPGEAFHGEVSYVGPQTEPGTRFVPVHVRLPNPEGKLPIGMPAEIRVETGAARLAVVVPRTAVIFEEGVQVVFVQVAPDRFERRVIRLGEAMPAEFEVHEGLASGDRVVVRGAFLIKGEGLKGAFPPAEAGETGAERERERGRPQR